MKIEGNVTINNQSIINENSDNEQIFNNKKGNRLFSWISVLAAVATIISMAFTIVVWKNEVKTKSLKEKSGIATERSIIPFD